MMTLSADNVKLADSGIIGSFAKLHFLKCIDFSNKLIHPFSVF